MGKLIFATVAATVLLGILGEFKRKRGNRREQEKRRREEFGKNPMKLRWGPRRREFLSEIKVYYEETKELLPKNRVDDVTWNDLDMDEIFFRINHTRSYIGEQVLYHRLHETGTKRDWEQWERRLAYLKEQEEKRLRLEEKLEQIGKNRADYYLPMFLCSADCLKVAHSYVYRILQFLLAGSFLAAVITKNAVFVALLIGTALVNLGVYAVSKSKYEVYLSALLNVKQLILFCKSILEEPEWSALFEAPKVREAVESLEKLTHLIGNFQVKKTAAWTGDVMDLLRDYLIGISLWDITVFGRIMKIVWGKQKELFCLYEFTGEIDIEIAAASFRESLFSYCTPEFAEEKTILAEGMYHLLLEEPVCNDLHMKKNCLITGANASGKSTFVKAAAVNAILAQTIHTCMAQKFQMPHLRVMTSMAVRDDILSGESYYIREVGYLKRIVDAGTKELPVFCLIDEILRGTNTQERLAASEAVLRYLADQNYLIIAATHDLELAERLSGRYDCYYFQSEIRDTDIYFDYKMYKGLGGNRNAVLLLAYMGFPKEVVETAQRLSASGSRGF